jgi:hypothetical protein
MSKMIFKNGKGVTKHMTNILSIEAGTEEMERVTRQIKGYANEQGYAPHKENALRLNVGESKLRRGLIHYQVVYAQTHWYNQDKWKGTGRSKWGLVAVKHNQTAIENMIADEMNNKK